MFVSSKCTETIREFEQYRYPEVKAEQNAKEDPVKDNDHCMDALRYFVACWYARGAEARETRRRLIAARPGKPVRPALERLWERHERMVAGGR